MAGKRTEIKRFMRRLERPARSMMFILQDVEDPVNVGAAFRIADACGATPVILTGISARPPHRLITRVGRDKHRRVPWRFEVDSSAALDHAAETGYLRLALEITPQAVPYHQRDYPDRVCLVVGHEDHGVTQHTLAHTDGAVFVPMYGKGASLNVHVALGIAAFHVLHAPPASRDLDPRAR